MSSQSVSLLAKIFQQAVITFNVANSRDLQRNLVTLKSLVDTIRYSDLNLDQGLISKSFFSQPDRAPCTYVGMYEDQNFSMSVFIMRENYTMPLHDHPQMNGLLKCIAGKLRIQGYSLDTDKEAPLDVIQRLQTPRFEGQPKKHIHCIKETPVEVDESSPAVQLNPTKGNMHQITALGGPVAFFDILSPPYDTQIAERPILKRKCTFFKEISQSSADQVVLEKIAQPLDYYCNHVEYN